MVEQVVEKAIKLWEEIVYFVHQVIVENIHESVNKIEAGQSCN